MGVRVASGAVLFLFAVLNPVTAESKSKNKTLLSIQTSSDFIQAFQKKINDWSRKAKQAPSFFLRFGAKKLERPWAKIQLMGIVALTRKAERRNHGIKKLKQKQILDLWCAPQWMEIYQHPRSRALLYWKVLNQNQINK